jgi:DedD protein
MAFFKFRKRADEPVAAPLQSESIETMRKRAKYRLAGAAVLVLIGVIGFPILFDQQPRPIAVDTPIEIPDRNKAKPLTGPAPVPLPSPESATSAPTQNNSAALVVSAAMPAIPPATVASTSIAPKSIPNEDPKPVEKPVAEPAKKLIPSTPKADDGNKAQALLDGKEPDKKPPANGGRFVVQVGAFSEAARAREVRLKVERVGLKTYTQLAQTKDGQRIRVRVGPFATKPEAEKAAAKIKKLDLPAALLTL